MEKICMYFIDALSLLRNCIAADILRVPEENLDQVLVYRDKGETEPEGWYAEDIYSLAQELTTDEEGINILKQALKEKGIDFKETYKEIEQKLSQKEGCLC